MPDFGRWTSNGGDPSLNEINRSDRFIEALSLNRPVYSTDPEEAELAYLLAGWRDDARQPPMSGIAIPRDAVAALNRGTPRDRARFPMAVVGSVAAAVLCLGGFGAAVYGSGPGDALYGVRGLLFGQQQVTRDVQVELASNELEQVQQLIDQGQWQQAQEKLQTLTTTVATVEDVEQKQELVNQWQQLSVKVENRDPNATVPADAPPPVLPEVIVTTPTTSVTDTTTLSEATTAPSGTTTAPSDVTTDPSGTTTPDTATPTTSPLSPTPTESPATTTPPSAATTTPPSPTTPPSSVVPPATIVPSAPTTTPNPAVQAPQPSTTEPVVPDEPEPTVTVEPEPAVPDQPEPTVTVEPEDAPTVERPRPSTRTTTTTLPAVAVPTVGDAGPESVGSAGGDQEPVFELPLLPGMGGSSQR